MLKKILVLTCFVALTFSSKIILSAMSMVNDKEILHSEKVLFPLKPDLPIPVRLKIPKIKVDSEIEQVGISKGRVDVPKGPTNAAWFNLGPHPGENGGSAVIVGHSGWKNGIPAVFDDLYKLQKGDKIYVEDDKGGTTVFVVRESRIYDPDADAPEVFGSSDGQTHLNLITCTGLWSFIRKGQSDRLVIFADKE